MLPRRRSPTSPGEILLVEYLRSRGLSQTELARRMSMPVQRVNTIVHGRRRIDAETAVLLGEALNTTAELWMGLQADFDLWHALRDRAQQRKTRRHRAA